MSVAICRAWPLNTRSNGTKLTGADPHGTKYSARDGSLRARVRCSAELGRPADSAINALVKLTGGKAEADQTKAEVNE